MKIAIQVRNYHSRKYLFGIMVLINQKNPKTDNNEVDKIKIPPDFVLKSFPSLVEADIRIDDEQDHSITYVPVIKLFKKFSNVKLLKLSGSSYRGVHSDLEDDTWTVNSLPQYSLSNLKFVVIRHFIGCKLELDVVKFFLANAGVLQMMTITTSQCLSKDYKKQMRIASELLKLPRSSTSCVLEFLTQE
ncbi:hypothetical protein MKX01_010681 [Papaver californicum]|nr:hypothetical protein MKX01_010681 [Papaver californicum]